MAESGGLLGPYPLARDHEVSGFDCGSASLNDYLKRYARQSQRKNAARTYVVCRGQRVVGYYSLAYGSVEHATAPPRLVKGIGKYPVPVLVLARLAVDLSEQGKGLGQALLRDALLRAVEASEIAGMCAVLVQAKDAAARAYYERFGFEASPLAELQLFISLEEIRHWV
jgi:predicted N-acetyltransferase YhbS